MKCIFSRAIPALAALTAVSSACLGQPTYDYTRILVETALYQQTDPGGNWGLNGDYLLYLPDDYNPENDPYPVLFFLHGAGALGNDLTKVSNLPPMLQAENGNRDFSFIVVAPQCLPAFRWSEEAVQVELMTFFQEVAEIYNIDEDRIYLCGQSMGGRGTSVLLDNYPDYFAAAAPICGANDPATAPALVDIPIWAFHGRLDQTIVPEFSIDMVNAIVAAGGTRARLTIYEDIGHEVWWTVFKRPDIYDWFLSHRKGVAPEPSWGEQVMNEAGYADTGDWLGVLKVDSDPWIWRPDSGEWMFFPQSHIISSGGHWVYTERP